MPGNDKSPNLTQIYEKTYVVVYVSQHIYNANIRIILLIPKVWLKNITLLSLYYSLELRFFIFFSRISIFSYNPYVVVILVVRGHLIITCDNIYRESRVAYVSSGYLYKNVMLYCESEFVFIL